MFVGHIVQKTLKSTDKASGEGADLERPEYK